MIGGTGPTGCEVVSRIASMVGGTGSTDLEVGCSVLVPGVGGTGPADSGVEQSVDKTQNRVLISRRRRKRKSEHKHKPIKRVQFAPMCDLYEFEGDENDEYTFDNVWDDGSPRVRQSRPPGRPVGPLEMPNRRSDNVKAEVMAHHKAVQWITGGWVPLARSIIFQGRRNYFDPDDVDDSDEIFTLEYDQEKAKSFVNYTLDTLVVWGEDFAWYLDYDFNAYQYVPCHVQYDHEVSPDENLYYYKKLFMPFKG